MVEHRLTDQEVSGLKLTFILNLLPLKFALKVGAAQKWLNGKKI